MGWSIGTISSRQSSAGNPITLAVTIAAGENLFALPLVVAGATNRAGGAPTLGPYTLEQANTVQKAATSPETSSELWYCLNPAPGSYTLTIPNTNAATIRYHTCAARTAAGGSVMFVAAAGANGTSTNPTATVPCGGA